MWRTRHAGARLRNDDPQEPRFEISSRDNSSANSALRHAAAEPSLHRRHTRQAAGRVGRAEAGDRHRGAQRLGPAAVVEAWRAPNAENAWGRRSWKGRTMNSREEHKIWIEADRGAKSINALFG